MDTFVRYETSLSVIPTDARSPQIALTIECFDQWSDPSDLALLPSSICWSDERDVSG